MDYTGALLEVKMDSGELRVVTLALKDFETVVASRKECGLSSVSFMTWVESTAKAYMHEPIIRKEKERTYTLKMPSSVKITLLTNEDKDGT